MGKYHPRNQLNDLTGSEWLQFTRTWFTCDSRRYYRNRDTELHPARFPEEMVADFLRFFTKAGGWVLDPFGGSGATLVSCAEQERNGVAVELAERYVEVMRRRVNPPQAVLHGDAREIAAPAFWEAARPELEAAGLPFAGGLPVFDYSISSPPYGAMLHTSRGGVYSKQKQRKDKGLDTTYSLDERDLGNIAGYEAFVAELAGIYRGAARLIKPQGYLTIVIQNFRAPDGEVYPLAWDLTRALSETLSFQGERIWCQNSKPLGIWGYPRVFVPNYHHHYCLIFRTRG
ncbi:MAG: DNA methyltransferase [Armatimonadota bacterium]